MALTNVDAELHSIIIVKLLAQVEVLKLHPVQRKYFNMLPTGRSLANKSLNSVFKTFFSVLYISFTLSCTQFMETSAFPQLALLC